MSLTCMRVCASAAHLSHLQARSTFEITKLKYPVHTEKAWPSQSAVLTSQTGASSRRRWMAAFFGARCHRKFGSEMKQKRRALSVGWIWQAWRMQFPPEHSVTCTKVDIQVAAPPIKGKNLGRRANVEAGGECSIARPASRHPKKLTNTADT